MSCKKLIYQGDNGVVKWPMLAADGSPLDFATLHLVKVEIIQNKKVLGTFIMGEDGEVRQDVVGTLEYEYTSAFTETLNKALTILKVTLEYNNAELVIDPYGHVELEAEIFTIR